MANTDFIPLALLENLASIFSIWYLWVRLMDRSQSFVARWPLVYITCIVQARFGIVPGVAGKSQSKRRSDCPVSISLEIFGDRWSLLIVRDLMVRGYRTFKEFQASGEGIATNILSDRLSKLQAGGIITAAVEKRDGRKLNYRLTEKGIDLAPVLLDLLIWGARHEQTGAPCAVIDQMEQNRQQVLAETRRRWQERDSTPILPKFEARRDRRSLTRTRQLA